MNIFPLVQPFYFITKYHTKHFNLINIIIMIKSSFKKIEKKSEDINKAYFGHPQLDAIFNNNLKKGHVIVIQQDHPTTIYINLLRYFIGSSYHKLHHSQIYDSLNPSKWQAIIPQVEKQKTQKIQKNNNIKSEIAWRYDNMNINLNNLPISQDSNFLDLSKNVQIEKAKEYIHCFSYEKKKLKELYQQIYNNLLNSLKDSNDIKLRKIVLTSLPNTMFQDPQFLQFLHAFRCLVRCSHVLAVITIPSIRYDQNKKLLEGMFNYSDYYLKINGKLGLSYSHFTGTIAVLKEFQVGNIDNLNRGITVWGIKSKNKKEIRIQSLYQNLGEQSKQQGLACGIKMKDKLQF